MIHASWNAVVAIVGGDGPKEYEFHHGLGVVAACSWAVGDMPSGGFLWLHAERLMRGADDCLLPTCPVCAMFVDLALSIRAESEQQRINEEIDKERKAS